MVEGLLQGHRKEVQAHFSAPSGRQTSCLFASVSRLDTTWCSVTLTTQECLLWPCKDRCELAVLGLIAGCNLCSRNTVASAGEPWPFSGFIILFWAGLISPHMFMWHVGHGDKNFHWDSPGDNIPQKQCVPKQAQQDDPVGRYWEAEAQGGPVCESFQRSQRGAGHSHSPALWMLPDAAWRRQRAGGTVPPTHGWCYFSWTGKNAICLSELVCKTTLRKVKA